MKTLATAIAAATMFFGAVHAAEEGQSPSTFTIGGGESVAAEHGAFDVPAVRSRGRAPGNSLTLRFVRFKSSSPNPGPPIVFLAGGPGDAATRAFQGMPRNVLESLARISDVIAFDQRGTGTSDPAQRLCAPMARVPGAAGAQAMLRVPLDAPLDPAALGAAMREQLTACLENIDAAPFTTMESVDDIAALAHAIGAKRVRLYAGSYGTHLAIAAARQHPDLIAGMALLGVEGPDDTLKLPSRVDAVIAEIDHERPGVRAKIATLATRLRESPWTKTLPNGQRVTVGLWDFQRRVAESLSSTRDIDTMIAALDPMLGGDYSDLVRWTIPFRSPKPINVMHVAMDCASFASASRLAAIQAERETALLGDAINFPLPELCGTPGLPTLPDEFRRPLTSSVPALLVAGTFDGRTPPVNAAEVAAGLSNARVLTIPRASHALFQEPAALAAVIEFFTRLK